MRCWPSAAVLPASEPITRGYGILHGVELNIGRDGSLDYDHAFLMDYDWCVASVHSHFDLPKKSRPRG